jgi:hypothetical protein
LVKAICPGLDEWKMEHTADISSRPLQHPAGSNELLLQRGKPVIGAGDPITVGGSLNNQWASKSHIPALRQSPRHQITAVATSGMESALHSADGLGIPPAFDDRLLDTVKLMASSGRRQPVRGRHEE